MRDFLHHDFFIADITWETIICHEKQDGAPGWICWFTMVYQSNYDIIIQLWMSCSLADEKNIILYN